MTTINSRAEKLDRMVSLVKLQLRLSEWQLAQLRQQEKQLHDEEAYLVGALNGWSCRWGRRVNRSRGASRRRASGFTPFRPRRPGSVTRFGRRIAV